MIPGPPRPFGAHLKALREAAGFTQEELATIAGLSVHAVSALERGERRRPHLETVRALSAALDLPAASRDALLGSARTPVAGAPADESAGAALPLPPTPLLGRDADVRTLREWLTDATVRLITLVGPGGVGKTRLALEIARAVAAERSSRVAFVHLAATRNPAFVTSAVADALGLSAAPATELPARARAACESRPTLLVLDNFEQVMEAAPLVADLLTSAGSLRVLVTSRAPLRVRGEREFLVGPLALDVAEAKPSPADLARCPAVRLFLERVRDVRPGFRLTTANGPTVTAICRRLDALPLAIELAARWIKVLTPEDLLRRLSQDVLLPTAGPRDLPERQQTMNATVAWSYQLLGASEQCAFRRLGVLPGRFPIEAAAAVLGGCGAPAGTDEALTVAAGLVDKSLLLRVDGSTATRPMYQMLETVRAFALVELAAAGDRDAAMDGLAGYCTGEAALARAGLLGSVQVDFLDRVRDDRESHRSALTWLIERQRPDEASSIAWGLMFYWLIRGHTAEGLGWYEQILNAPSLSETAELRALVGAGLMQYIRGDLDRTRVALARAIQIAPAVGDMEALAHAETLLGHVENAVGNPNAARDLFAHSLATFQAADIPWGISSAMTGLASAALRSRDVPQAERLLDGAASLTRSAGPWFRMPALYLRAILAVRTGKPDEAVALLRENLAGLRDLRDRFAFVYALIPLAFAAVLKGDDAWAARLLGARAGVIERSGISVADNPIRDLQEQAERDARARLGSDRWAAAYAIGRRASIDSAQDLHRFVEEGLRSTAT
jgi:predicted ATPase/DNA-binding XRE family transcriptional regulator